MINKIINKFCWIIGFFLPIDKKKIVFCSYYGRGYSDSPKAIAEELIKINSNLKLVWLVKNNKEALSLPKEIKSCPYNSIKRIWTLSTAKIWIDNCRKYDKFKKRNQYYIQTWHGFPLKRIEKDAILPEYYVRNAIQDSKKTDLMISNCKFVTKIYKNSFWYNGEIAEFGFPRNDCFSNDNSQVNKKVKNFFSLPKNRKILLYAPTFRNNNSVEVYSINAKKIQEACNIKFGGKWTVLIRLHPNIGSQSKNLFKYDKTNIIDATMYPDMQELLCASDILLTDYSSSMFDFCISKKPCFMFANDINEYMKERNFYFSLDKLPFPLATSNDELVKNIKNFNINLYLKNLNSWSKKHGFLDDGKASERCAKLIIDKIKKEF